MVLWLIMSHLDDSDPKENWGVQFKGRYNGFSLLNVNTIQCPICFFFFKNVAAEAPISFSKRFFID